MKVKTQCVYCLGSTGKHEYDVVGETPPICAFQSMWQGYQHFGFFDVLHEDKAAKNDVAENCPVDDSNARDDLYDALIPPQCSDHYQYPTLRDVLQVIDSLSECP